MIFLRKFLTMKIPPKEISALAKRTASEIEAKSPQVKEQCRILWKMILEKGRQIAGSKKVMTTGNNKAHKIFPLSQSAFEQGKWTMTKMRKIKEKRAEMVWNLIENCMNGEIPDNHTRADPKKETYYRRYGEPSSEPTIYGGI